MAKKESSSDRKKGTFSAIRLPIAKQYIFPPSRRRMLLYGAIAALLLGGYYAFAGLSKGRLSSSHASLERDCAACHTSFRSVTSEKCAVCHEKSGDRQAAYSLAVHSVYRSGDMTRTRRMHPQVACFACHPEHGGRDAPITHVPDTICANCHGFRSFDSDHPQFAFVERKLPDDADLEFPHARHVREIMKRQGLADLEKACLACHHPRPDGKTFQPIAFDTDCGSCHMTGSTRSTALVIQDASHPLQPGVETLEMIRASGRAGSSWVNSVSPAELHVRGDSVVKSPLRHKDPWIMDNLRRIRRTLYPNEGLQELLDVRGTVESDDPATVTKAFYDEALDKLEHDRDGLSGRPEPEVQQELVQVNALLKAIDIRIRESESGGPVPAEFIQKPELNRTLNATQIEELRNFALELTAPCRQCHVVTDAAIQRVQKDQRILHRAHFDHRAHVLQRRCLDCHNRISLEGSQANAAATDRAEVQNIPGIETCRTCHNAGGTSQSCATCHDFHPNKERRSGMLLYVDAATGSQ